MVDKYKNRRLFERFLRDTISDTHLVGLNIQESKEKYEHFFVIIPILGDFSPFLKVEPMLIKGESVDYLRISSDTFDVDELIEDFGQMLEDDNGNIDRDSININEYIKIDVSHYDDYELFDSHNFFVEEYFDSSFIKEMITQWINDDVVEEVFG